MQYTCPDLKQVLAQMQVQELLPEITRWNQLDTYQTMSLLKEYVAFMASGPTWGDLARPEDTVIAYRDIHDRPNTVLQVLEQWLGIELPHQIERVYEQYLMLNQQLRSKYWRP